mgnify:FL=1
MFQELNQRSIDIFKQIVEKYLATGAPVGSKTLCEAMKISISPASIRNIMANLEKNGFLYSSHPSSGRIPTERGLRMFVDGLLEIGDLTKNERKNIEMQAKGKNIGDILSEATTALSGLSKCAGLVTAPKTDGRIKHIEFLYLEDKKALTILIYENGDIENRIIPILPGLTQSMLIQATNYVNDKLDYCTMDELRNKINKDISNKKIELDKLTKNIIKSGLAVIGNKHKGSNTEHLIVKGRANLLQDVNAMKDLERIRLLFEDLDSQKELVNLLDSSENASGVKIYIGSENKLFSLSGSALIISPYKNNNQKIVGAIGVIGPTRMNYGKVIPMVDYTAKIIQKILN